MYTRPLDARADVFSLGCVLFECVTGQSAFSGAHLMALLAKILLEEVPRMSELRPGVPASLDALVASMLAKEPSRRPRDAAAVLAALMTIESEPIPATEAAPVARLRSNWIHGIKSMPVRFTLARSH